jgi:16S rRNA (adenine1518-N6/adenine1519-N6)-dimethyltransferase
MYRPSELHTFLNSSALYAKKRLSQNFLIDGNVLRNILKAAEVQEGDLVIEIGPGPGALTEALLKAGATVIAIELDLRFAEALKRLQTPKLTIVEADILAFPLEEYLQGKKKAKIISNLPYHISSPVLDKLLPMEAHISTLTLMVQKEFALRMAAKEKSSDYSPLSLFVQAHSRVLSSFPVSPKSFFPVPKVDSTVITLELKKKDALHGKSFFAFLKTAFQHRRKTLASSLREFAPRDTIQEALGKNPQARPEELSLEEWSALFCRLCT